MLFALEELVSLSRAASYLEVYPLEVLGAR